jgi:hypothetical protein
MKRVIYALGFLLFVLNLMANGQEDLCRSCSVTQDPAKSHRWVAAKTLSEDIGRVDETMGRLVGLQRILGEDAASEKSIQHLKLGMDGQEGRNV